MPGVNFLSFFSQSLRPSRQQLEKVFLSQPYFFLIGVYLLSRFSLILWGLESIFHYEELEQGYIAVEILSGLRTRLIEYQVDEYTGGTLMLGILAVPFFILFGPTLFSLKLLALTISLITLTLVYFIVLRLWGKTSAFIVGLLWIFQPPLLYTTSLMALGSHERRLPLFFMIYCFLEYASKERDRPRQIALLGVSWGLAFSFSFINFIAITAGILALCVLKHYPQKLKSWMLLMVSMTAGAGCWIYYNAVHLWTGVHFFLSATIASSDIALRDQPLFLLKDIANFFLRILPNALSFQSLGLLPGKELNYIYFIALVFMMLPDMLKTFRAHYSPLNPYTNENAMGVPDGRHALKIFFIIYIMLFPLFYFLSKNKIPTVEADAFNYRYLVPFYAVTFLYCSVIISELPRKKYVLALFLIVGFLSQVQTSWAQPFGQVFQQPGFKSGLRHYIWWNAPSRSFTDVSEFERDAEKLSNDELKRIANHDAFWQLASSSRLAEAVLNLKKKALRRYFLWRWPNHLEIVYHLSDLKTINDIGRLIPLPYRRDFYIGCARRLNFSEWADFQEVLAFLQHPELPYREIFYLYWGKSLYDLFRNGYERRELFDQKMDFVSQLSHEQKLWIYRGMGMSIYRSFQSHKILEMNFKLLEEVIPKDYHGEPYWGVGWYLGRRYFKVPEKALQRIALLPAEAQDSARSGFHAFHEGYEETIPKETVRG